MDARVSEKINIDHEILYYKRNLNDVINSFINSYVSGEAIPCVQCNQTVKFRDFLNMQRLKG